MRGRTLGWALAVTAVIVVVVGLLEGSWTATGPVAASPTTPPLASSAASNGQSAVLLPMGHLDDPANTFWELFLRSATGPSWVLSTPPGVADNGGLVVSLSAAGPVTVGFLPSADLTFSPVAQRTGSTRAWSSGQLPSALADAPSGLASDSAGGLLALSPRAGGSVFSSTGGLSDWVPLVTGRSLAPSVRDCRAPAVTAVALDQSAHPVLGLSCAGGGRLGVAAPDPTPGATAAWRDIGPPVAGGIRHRSTVLRLEPTDGGLSGLGSVTGGSTRSLLAFWGQGEPVRWRQSPPVAVPAGWSVESTGVGGGSVGQTTTVLLGSGDRRRILESTGPTGKWIELPDAPDDTGVVATLSSETDAFVADGGRLTVWAWSTGLRTWRRVTSIQVPIQYGSSS